MTIAESIQLNKEQIARAFGVPAHMLADPDRTAVPRYWSLCMTSENHGTVGKAGDPFSHAPGKHERVLVVEVPAAAGTPVDQVNLQLIGAHRRRPVAEFKGDVNGQPAMTWLDRNNMPCVGTKLFADAAPASTAPTNERTAFEHQERESNLRRAGVEHDGSGGWYENPCVQSAWEGWKARAEVAAQTGQVTAPSQSWEAIGPVPIERDENGWWSHPAIPNFDEDVDSYLAWVKAIGLEMKYKALESDPDHPLYDAWFEHGECNASSWSPEEPVGDGWFTFSIHDSEDGPIWAWARRVDRAAVLASASGERQEGGVA